MSERLGPSLALMTAQSETGPRSKGQVFEAFDAPQPRDFRFENEYRGVFADRMELNRSAVERFCQVLDLDGRIYLTAGRLNDPQNLNNSSFSRIQANPRGWIITVDDLRLERHVAGKKSALPMEDRYISAFNKNVRQGLAEVARREWLTDERHPEFKAALTMTAAEPLAIAFILRNHFETLPSSVTNLFLIAFFTIGAYGMINLSDAVYRTYTDRHFLSQRNMDSVADIRNKTLRPPLAIDNVVAARAYLKTKARAIVRKAA